MCIIHVFRFGEIGNGSVTPNSNPKEITRTCLNILGRGAKIGQPVVNSFFRVIFFFFFFLNVKMQNTL